MAASAPVTVATLAAPHAMAGGLAPPTIAREAFEVEHEVQGRASPIDTSTSAAGGGVLVLRDPKDDLLWSMERDTRRWSLHRVHLPAVEFVVGHTGIIPATGPLVSRVRDLVEHDERAAEAIREIGRITLDGLEALRRRDLLEAGRLMDRN